MTAATSRRTSRTTSGRTRDAAPTRRRSTLRAVALPAEHGGWSLTLEPVALGLVVAWSWPGLALGAAALVAFVARTPLKVVLVDRWRARRLDRTRVALGVATLELALLVVLVIGAARTAAPWFWAPLVAAMPLVVTELWFDMRSRSRRLLPELAGAIGIGSVAAAIALAGGSSTALALGLWCVVAARSASAIPSVRNQIARAHGRRVRAWPSDVAQLVAVGAVAVGWLSGAVPPASVVVMVVVAVFGLRAVRTPPPRPAIIGIHQMLVGAIVVAVTAAAVTLG